MEEINTTLSRYNRKSASTLADDHPAKPRLVDLESAFSDAFFLPNFVTINDESFRMKRPFRDRKSKGRSVAGIVKMQAVIEDKKSARSEHVKEKEEKEDRIAHYWHDVNENKEIAFIEDEQRTYNAHLRFCRILGLVTQEDFE